MQNFMDLAIEKAEENAADGFKKGGPFGVVIVKDNKVIAACHNSVISDCDATAHAEINAIREAGAVLGTHDLTGCELWTSCMPCPMCLSAIIWANIKVVHYANTSEDADKIGFRDKAIYEFFAGKSAPLELIREETPAAIKTFEKFMEHGEIY
ncbi:MAG: nucleoside deaminase [Clostridiales bacterium]|jgi:guanine deaminase|nr:nucleoside deaminase [Clostridiales bacterium]